MALMVLLLLLLLNGLLAMSEMAVVSSRKVRLQRWADEGRPGAQSALALSEQPSRFLSTVQVGITLIGITSGALGEASLASALADWLAQWNWVRPHAQGVAGIIVVAAIAIAALLIGELVPKRLALVNPEGIASAVAKPMWALSRLTYPLVRALTTTTDAVLRLLGVRETGEPPVTEEEIKVLMEQGAQAGVFEQHEQSLVKRAFQFGDLKVRDVMTPRKDVVFLDLEDTTAANLQRIVSSGHSRFPVGIGGLDRLQGVVHTKALLEDAVSGKPVELSSRLSKALFVPEVLTLLQLVELFKSHRQTMALAIDEYGEFQGLVTRDDVIGALAGDIATVENSANGPFVQRADGSWLVDADVGMERFADVVEPAEPPPAGDYHTLGGFVMLQLGRVPRVADRFDWAGLRFEVVDMDGNRVDKLIVTKLASLG
jgi:putative hemolysin